VTGLLLPRNRLNGGVVLRSGGPRLNPRSSLVVGLLWDGVDLGSKLVQLCPGYPIAPPFNTYADAGNFGVSTTFQYPGKPGGTQRGIATTFGAADVGGLLGWLPNGPNPGACTYGAIRAASHLFLGNNNYATNTLANSVPPSGFTAACTYRQTGTTGYTQSIAGLIFGRFLNAFEAQPFSAWTFANTNNGEQVTFAWNNNGTQNYINWSSGLPPLNSIVSLIATVAIVPSSVTLAFNPPSGSLTDAASNVWTFGSLSSGQYPILMNGTVYDGGYAGLGMALGADGFVYVLSNNGYWFATTNNPGQHGMAPYNATVKFYGSINGGPLVLIGTVTGQWSNGYWTSGGEDQIGWGQVTHISTGDTENPLYGNALRGSFWGRVLGLGEVRAYASDPDSHHLWPEDAIWGDLHATAASGGGVMFPIGPFI
jgi:hypothetical protein